MANHFYEIIQKQNTFDLQREYRNLQEMFYHQQILLHNPHIGTLTIYYEIDNNFKKVKFNDGSFRSLWDFDEYYKICFRTTENAPDKDFYILFCEYIISLLDNYDFTDNELISFSNEIRNYINNSISKLNYIQTKKEGFIVFVPKDETLLEVAAKAEPTLSEKILIYRHHSLNGKLDEKRDILNRLALELEPKRDTLSSLASNMTSDLFAAFNNFSIRHNNSDSSDSKKYNQKFSNLKDNEKEELYDYIFQYCLIALKLLDNKKCKDLIEKYKQ